jgi:glucokinase
LSTQQVATSQTRIDGHSRTEWVAAAVDIGGTKIAAGLVDASGRVLHRVQVATPATGSATDMTEAVFAVLDLLQLHPAWNSARWIGIGSAGPVDLESGTVSPVNIPAWRNFPLLQCLRAHPAVEDRTVTLSGDAVAMAAAEHWIGAARGYRNALCLVVSTGVGAGLVLDGAVRHGPSGNAGHLGHISVQFDGEDCPCGSRGCLEGLSSGPAIIRHALRAGWSSGCEPATAAAVAASARAGSAAAIAAFDRAGRALAAGIAATAALVDLEIAVIGGGVAEAGHLLFEPVCRHLRNYASLSFTAQVQVERATLRTDAGIVGAAAIAAAAHGGDLARPR